MCICRHAMPTKGSIYKCVACMNVQIVQVCIVHMYTHYRSTHCMCTCVDCTGVHTTRPMYTCVHVYFVIRVFYFLSLFALIRFIL
jgi:hypothetical protein